MIHMERSASQIHRADRDEGLADFERGCDAAQRGDIDHHGLIVRPKNDLLWMKLRHDALDANDGGLRHGKRCDHETCEQPRQARDRLTSKFRAGDTLALPSSSLAALLKGRYRAGGLLHENPLGSQELEA